MTPAARAHAYLRQKPGVMSPRQQRRYRQKVFRGLLNSVAGAGGVPATDCAPTRAEGHPAHAPTVTPVGGGGLPKGVVVSLFRKKPVVIEAMQLVDADSRDAIRLWIQSHEWSAYHSDGWDGRDFWLKIETLEGVMVADQNDWIIRGVKGEFYPCKPDIFEATYDAVDAAPGASPQEVTG